MSLHLVTDTKITPRPDESVMGAVYEAEKLRDRTGKRVSVMRDAGLPSCTGICTFLGRDEWNPGPRRADGPGGPRIGME